MGSQRLLRNSAGPRPTCRQLCPARPIWLRGDLRAVPLLRCLLETKSIGPISDQLR